MKKSTSNLYYKTLKLIQNSGVNNFRDMAKELGVSEYLFKIIINSLEEKEYLRMVNENEFKTGFSLGCKFCPFANDCRKNERIPSLYYEISEKGKKILNTFE